ncbi:MAG: hypothetical protein QOG92_2625, partial [Verrucomicrobiota bacterium]|nr:hypothetical protein [Verrucomicrobiota bacterium]
HSDVENDVTRRRIGSGFEPDPHPAVRFVGAFEAFRGYGVRKNKEL